jgi:ribosomal protein L11 methyltransferase
MNYYKLTIETPEDIIKDIIVAHLSEFEFNGFQEEEGVLVAYIAQNLYSLTLKTTLDKLIVQYGLQIDKQCIEDQNWNEKWESDYEPVLVDDFCAVRATFHSPVTTVKYEIVVTPKMSFGTGHHATTFMMMKQMEKLNFTGKSVFDYGCGTGVLAILAHKLGAVGLDAVDIDKWAYENTVENIGINNSEKAIEVFLGEINALPVKKYDIVLANINRNVILNTMKDMAFRLNKGGFLLTSGFLEKDIVLVVDAAKKFGLSLESKMQKDKWRSLLFSLS